MRFGMSKMPRTSHSLSKSFEDATLGAGKMQTMRYPFEASRQRVSRRVGASCYIIARFAHTSAFSRSQLRFGVVAFIQFASTVIMSSSALGIGCDGIQLPCVPRNPQDPAIC